MYYNIVNITVLKVTVQNITAQYRDIKLHLLHSTRTQIYGKNAPQNMPYVLHNNVKCCRAMVQLELNVLKNEVQCEIINLNI